MCGIHSRLLCIYRSYAFHLPGAAVFIKLDLAVLFLFISTEFTK